MYRISREEMWIETAEVVAQRGTCRRLRVGAVITNSSLTKAVAIGYNGNAAGLPNICDTDEVGACGCVHAELNAMLKAPGGVSTDVDLVLFVTHSPCASCAKAIINTGIGKVYFRQFYRKTDGIDLLQAAHITVISVIPPAGLPVVRATV